MVPSRLLSQSCHLPPLARAHNSRHWGDLDDLETCRGSQLNQCILDQSLCVSPLSRSRTPAAWAESIERARRQRPLTEESEERGHTRRETAWTCLQQASTLNLLDFSLLLPTMSSHGQPNGLTPADSLETDDGPQPFAFEWS